MRILHVYRTYFPDTQGGLEEVIRQVCRNTLARGCEHRVFTLSADPDPVVVVRPEAEVYRASLTLDIASCGIGLGAFGLFRRLAAWADLVHFHYPWPFQDVLYLGWARDKPALVTYHSDVVRQQGLMTLYRPLMRRFLAHVDRIVATSSAYARTSPVLSALREKVQVIPIGLDESTLPAASPAVIAQMRRRFGEGFFFFVGVLRYYKALPVLMEAAAGAPFQVVIAGEGPAGERLRATARARFQTNVRFAGQISDEQKVALLFLCRGVVLPSRFRAEAFGVALVEGLIAGRPLISTELGTGTSYVNADGESGLVVAPSSVGELRAALTRLHEDPGLARELGSGARRRYERLFTGAAMGQAYAELYRQLLHVEAPQARSA